jgi:hypothetical protein
MKRVLDIGNCSMDHGAISGMLQKQFGAEVVQCHGQDDSLAALRARASSTWSWSTASLIRTTPMAWRSFRLSRPILP